MSKAGFDPEYGRKLVHELEDVGPRGRRRRRPRPGLLGRHPGTAFIRLSLESLSGALVEAGALSEDDIDAALALVDDPANVFVSPLMIAAWGRKP